MTWKHALCALLMTAAGCGASADNDTRPAPETEAEAANDTTPWSARRLGTAEVPRAYVDAWSAAPNRSTCALIAFSNSELTSGATPRTATFSGGWSVAYDRGEMRSAFGIAGTGVAAANQTFVWPYNLEWPDGSTVGYGPEGGGAGPNQLAYLQIKGQTCLYNVWSRISRQHLEQLLASIRFVETGP